MRILYFNQRTVAPARIVRDVLQEACRPTENREMSVEKIGGPKRPASSSRSLKLSEGRIGMLRPILYSDFRSGASKSSRRVRVPTPEPSGVGSRAGRSSSAAGRLRFASASARRASRLPLPFATAPTA